MGDKTEPQLLTTRAIAARCSISEQTLRKLRCLGGGPPFVKFGDGPKARVLYRLSDVEAWLAARTFRSTTDVAVRKAELMKEFGK